MSRTTKIVDLKLYKKKKVKTRTEGDNIEDQNIMSDLLSDFLKNTTIHGIPYLGAKDNNLLEKAWWTIGLILSVTTCTYLVCQTWNKWNDNPVIVSFAQKHTSVWEIPFPAVTICPSNRVQQSKFNYSACYANKITQEKDIFADAIWNVTGNTKKFWDISLICDRTFMSLDYLDAMENELDNLDITDENIINNIKMVANEIALAIWTMSWQNKEYINGSQSTFFAELITSEGLCFTFNALGHDDMYTDQMKEGVRLINNNSTSTGWSMEEGYSSDNEDKTYPARTSQAGIIYGLSASLLVDANDRTKYCDDDFAGFKVVLHNPAEIPRLSENYVLIPTDKKVIVSVNPKVIKTSKNLVSVSSYIRNCFFAHEKKLRFFKIYTQYNCKTECLSNITRQHCGCLPFYLPRDNDTVICGPAKIPCLDEASGLIFKYENQMKNRKIIVSKSEKKLFEIFQQCDCLASCYYIDYEVDVSQADNIYAQLYLKHDVEHRYNIEETPISIFFKESQFLALERKELYGSTDFIANIGGLLGLCMGFSFLSLLEIIYYATLRMWCKIYNKSRSYTVPAVEKPNPGMKIVWLN